jgi:hypothetical protein
VAAAGRRPGPARPGRLPPEVDAFYDAFKHPRAERPSLPLLPPVEARAYDHEVRGRVLDLIEHTAADELFTVGMVVQHEEQHDETMPRPSARYTQMGAGASPGQGCGGVRRLRCWHRAGSCTGTALAQLPGVLR